MSAGFLDKEDYDALLSKTGVGEICGYLKGNTVYSGVLADVNEEQIHRTELEKLIKEQCYSEYIRIFKFMGLYERKVFNYYIVTKEMEYIKCCIKKIFHTSEAVENTLPEPDEFFKNHTKLDLERLMKAEDFSSVMEACKDTGYYDVLYRENISELKSETVVMVLDIYYYTLLWKEIGKFIEKKSQSELLDLFGKKIDILNILWVYRCKRYFKVPDEMIYTHIIPISYKITRERLSDIVAGDIDYLVDNIQKTRYAGLFENIGKTGFAEENYRRIMYEIIRKKFRGAKEPVTLAVAYFLLKNIEIQNIKTITEGKRYSSDTESIRELIIY
jgi:V/A-type H+-transporting ATPase subunit C